MKNPTILARSDAFVQHCDWQSELKNMIRDLDSLLDYCELDISQLGGDFDACNQAIDSFALKVPPSYLSLIEKGNPTDPLLLQVLPQAIELESHPDAQLDPLGEAQFNPAPGLIHKYPGRVLLIANPSCAIHCRYCFRRHFDYDENTPGSQGWGEALEYIKQDTSLFEVILSGGDPLSHNNKQLSKLVEAISGIAHIKTLRIHSRIASTIPSRIDDGFIELFEQLPLNKVMVMHINHANEISPAVKAAVKRLKLAQFQVLNQSVLLKGVNNNTDTLEQLYWRGFEVGIMPYYLYVLDPIEGGMHFELSDTQACALYAELQQKMPAYMLPKLARELVGKRHKSLIFRNI